MGNQPHAVEQRGECLNGAQALLCSERERLRRNGRALVERRFESLAEREDLLCCALWAIWKTRPSISSERYAIRQERVCLQQLCEISFLLAPKK